MAIWSSDLTTQDGATGAAELGGYACFVSAALGFLALFMMLSLIQSGVLPAISGLVMLAENLLFVVAGFRLRAGKGAVLGIVVAVVLALELLVKLASLSIVGIIVDAILLVVVINGVRGAFALRKGRFEGDEAEIFR
jgi:hypothetical protein